MLGDFWQDLSRGARIGFISGVVLIVGLTAGIAVWTLRSDYQVLFANLSPQDAAAMSGELDRMKVPYQLEEGGTTLTVEKDLVHKTRIKLMGKDLPLHGAVGFELFNNADFAMTEFAQKVNYQRALQGELTRTILSISEVESARVHLALPEDGLFKRAENKAKASITLSLKRGQSLAGTQVAGIQRLVASAVPGMATQHVTIVNEHGVALTRATVDDADMATGVQLDVKRETEQYLVRKAAQVLERALGAGQALASVDVTLNLDQIRVTTEDVIPVPSKPNEASTGVVVRERETIRDPNGAALGRDATSSAGGSSQRDTEYQVGRRVEQVISQPGSIKRLQVVAVVSQQLGADRIEQVRALVGTAVGAVPQRGDSIIVQSIQLAGLPVEAAEIGPGGSREAGDSAAKLTQKAGTRAKPEPQQPVDTTVVTAMLALAAIVLVGLILALFLQRRAASRRSASAPLTDEQRRSALAKVQAWIHGAPAESTRRSA